MRYVIFACLLACGSKSAPPPAEPATPPPADPSQSDGAAGSCITTGCSGTICAKPGYDMVTTCEMKPEYQCYQGAECKVQASGECGWTMDDRMQKCLASPPPLQ
jgi:hypothetical protein